MERLKELNAALNGATFPEKVAIFRAMKKQLEAEGERLIKQKENEAEDIAQEMDKL